MDHPAGLPGFPLSGSALELWMSDPFCLLEHSSRDGVACKEGGYSALTMHSTGQTLTHWGES